MKIRKLLVFIFLLTVLLSYPARGADDSFKANLSGSELVPPVMTEAKGTGAFQTKGDKELTYTLTVTNIDGVTSAHIHKGRRGEDGPPVVNLSIKPEVMGKFSGTLSEGAITASDFIGLLKGKPLKSFIEMIEAGDAYVNVHTYKNPRGEIRGQMVYSP